MTGAAVALGPSAGAGTVTPTVHCVLPAGQGEATGPQSVTIDLDQTSVQPGGLIKGKVTLGESPAKSTVSMPDIPTTPTIQLTMKGAATGGVTIAGPEIPISVEAGKAVPIPPYEGTFNIPAAAVEGKIEFTIAKMVTYTKVFGTTFETTCDIVSGGDAVVASVDVEGAASEQPTVSAPAGPHWLGSEVPITGTKWTPGATPVPQLCNADNTACSGTRFASNTLAIDAQGNLSGKVKLATTGIPDGVNVIKISDGAKEASGPLETKLYVAGQRKVVMNPTSGPVGTIISFSGEEWSPNRSIQIDGADANGAVTGAPTVVTTTPDGKFTAQWTVNDARITQIRIREGTSSVNRVFVPFAVTTGPSPMSQTPTVTLVAGDLTMSQAGTGIDFGTATLNGEAQTLTAPLNQVTVVDARSGNLGWSLTGTMTDLVAGNGTDKIPAGNISWTPSCAATPNSPSTVTSGSPGPLGSAASTLCTQAPDPAKLTGGRFTADAQLTLTTPEFAAAGSYTGTLTLSLI